MIEPKLGDIKYDKKYREYRIWHACIDCGKERWVFLIHNEPANLRCRSCAAKQKHHLSGSAHPNWKGGRTTSNGYILVKLQPNDFFYPMVDKDGYVKEHRLIMAKQLGRCLQSWELVHHKDGVRDHNEYSNLKMTTKGSHIIEHSKGYREGYQKGLVDGRTKQIEELRQEIRLLRWQIKELKHDTSDI